MILRRTGRIASAIAFAVVLACALLVAQSQPPAPSPLVRSQPPQHESTTQQNRSDRGNAPIPAPRAQQQAQRPDEYAAEHDQQPASNDPPAKWWDWFTSERANWSIVGLTLVLAIIAFFQILTMWTADKHFVATERAWVVLTHEPPKQNFLALEYTEGADELWSTMLVQNHGRTPAEILGGLVWAEVGPDSTYPPGNLRTGCYKIPPTTLVPGDTYRFRTLVWGLGDETIKRAIRRQDIDDPAPLELWIRGFVLYRDQFGVEHCGGYGRHWNREAQDLVFDRTTAALNFDDTPTEEQNKQGQPNETKDQPRKSDAGLSRP